MFFCSEPVASNLLEVSDKPKGIFHILSTEDKEQSSSSCLPPTRNGQVRNEVPRQEKDLAEETGFVDDPNVPPLM